MAKKTKSIRGSRKNIEAQRDHFRHIILLEEKNLSQRAARDKDAIRKHPLSFECLRPNFWRDSDRILHSFAFNRFLDKTQVFYLNENSRLTHRMLHVQLVAKISRLLGRALRLNPHLVEAIALGHDIGHTPLGHEGERILSEISYKRTQKYFKHSVQGVRWLNILEKNSQHEGTPNNGLNLSLQVLDGILCHDGEDMRMAIAPDRTKSIGKFLKQYRQKQEKESLFLAPMSLEGCLVRFCDVIAYIGRDIDDAIAVGLVDRFPDTPLGKNNSQLIDYLVMDLLKASEGKEKIAYSRKTYNALKELYAFNMENIYKNHLITIHQKRIERLFTLVFEELLSHVKQKYTSSPIFKDHINSISEYYTDYVDKYDPEQVVIDFISGMTDSYFLDLAQKLILPGTFPVDFSDLARITGVPEKYIDSLITKRKTNEERK